MEAPNRHNRDSTALIHSELREAILRDEIAAGTDLSQVKLAKQFGVSRGPVREALRLLEKEGLIESRFNHRARVAAFSVKDLDELYGMRIVMESLGISVSVPRYSEDDLLRIHELLDQLEMFGELDTEADWMRWGVCHHSFHRALVAYAGDRTLRTIEQLHDHAERYRRFSRAHEPHSRELARIEHRAIVEACAQRNALHASVGLARHLSRIALSVLMEVNPDYEPMLVRAAVRQATAAEQPPPGITLSVR